MVLTVNSGQIRRTDKADEPQMVCCGECRHFMRDTDGINKSLATGKYFMGVCLIGHTPDTRIKQFANKRRTCKDYE